MKKITVIGDGGWGTTIAVHLQKAGFNIALWSASKEYARYLDKKRNNVKFLSGIKIPKAITITANMKEAVSCSELVVLAVPSCYMRKVLKKLQKADYKQAIILSVAKGLEEKNNFRMSQLIEKILGDVRFAVLSGPTIAPEVARDLPAACVVASNKKKIARIIQDVFATDRFRVYTSSDVVGVELGGSLKNIIALAAGISDGLRLGINAKATIATRGLAEISRLGEAMGAKKETFRGLSGLGDIVTTCMSPKSRNRQVGERIGRGEKLKDIVDKMEMVAEGIKTTKSAYQLGKKYKVEIPITNKIYEVLYRNKKPQDAVNDLMTRQTKTEISRGVAQFG
jgi:glycerol-3-phosphate dehydrogenase (NAD(P)+)